MSILKIWVQLGFFVYLEGLVQDSPSGLSYLEPREFTLVLLRDLKESPRFITFFPEVEKLRNLKKNKHEHSMYTVQAN